MSNNKKDADAVEIRCAFQICEMSSRGSPTFDLSGEPGNTLQQASAINIATSNRDHLLYSGYLGRLGFKDDVHSTDLRNAFIGDVKKHAEPLEFKTLREADNEDAFEFMISSFLEKYGPS